MAMQGINLAMMPLGMEQLWVDTFQSLGLTAQELEDFFPGPAFLAWGRMGNIQGYQGPLPAAYRQKQLALAKLVVARMRVLGINPVFPAFAGFVPGALSKHFPGALLTPSSNWCHFPSGYCCPLLLDASDPLFQRIGSSYITRLRQELGWDKQGYYIADSFNEMKPASSEPDYLAGISGSVFKAMTSADPSAVWLMQAWLFFSDHHFWQPPQIKVGCSMFWVLGSLEACNCTVACLLWVIKCSFMLTCSSLQQTCFETRLLHVFICQLLCM
jgi:alpha-N-acetylglucosaminidase